MTEGVFVCVVGPSGAGKDTLIERARAKLAVDRSFVFVRRMITRPSGPHEDHDSLGEAEFLAGVNRRTFALAWRAHGLGYAVPLSARDAVAAGSVVVCNVSRGIVGEARRVFSSVAVVLITAAPEIIAARLAARGRESGEEVRARLEREARVDETSPDETVVNDGPREDGAARLVRVLRDIRARVA